MNIIICVFACATIDKYKLELLKVIETWGKRADKLNVKVLYFLGEEQTEFVGEQFIYLKGVDNSYESASLKQNLGLKYIHDHYQPDYTLVCGTDTYINIDKLVLYLNNTNGDYIGGGGLKPLYFNMDKTYYYHSGAGFILSKRALTHLAPLLTDMLNMWKIQCHQYNTYYLILACDACISFYLQQFLKDEQIIKEPKLFYGCNYKGYVHHQLCCGSVVDIKNIILCHYMTLNDFDDYTKILNDNHFFCK
jgi:hypothetical protein